VTEEEEINSLVSVSKPRNSPTISIMVKTSASESLGAGSAASDAPPFETVVDEAEDGEDDEGAKIHSKKTFVAIFGELRA
jgi:hypothetical protein